MELVAAAKQYDGKSGAISVMSFADVFDTELWILWENRSITYLHMTEEELVSRYPAYDENGKPKEDPADYPDTENMGNTMIRKYLPQHWANVEELLREKKVAWMFGSPNSQSHWYDAYGFVCMDGTIYYMDTGKAEGNMQYVYASELSAVTEKGEAYTFVYTLMADGVRKMVPVKIEGTDAVQAVTVNNTQAVLQKDGTVVYSSTEDVPVPQDTVKATRFLVNTPIMETTDGRLVFIAEPETEICSWEDFSGVKNGATVDQIYMGAMPVIVFTDGSVQCDENHWLNGVTNVKVLNS